ncbi:MAG: sensor histidine kinase [Acutalibacter sp.]|jgi:signal transduction histidine kinase
MGWLAASVLAVIVATLGVKIWLLHRGVKALRLDLAQKLDRDTNTLLSLPCRDRELRRLAAALNQELRLLREERLRYQQGDRDVKEAVVNVSHDLRTPLTALAGYVELLKGEALPPDASRYLRQIEGRTKAMKAMTEELFRYSLAADETALTLEPVDLRAAVEESLLSFYGAFQQKGAVPQVFLPENPVVRQVDRGALSRVLGNILANALKYSGGDLAVTVTQRGQMIFSNLAPGLDPISAGRLFDRFYTVESSRQSTGLGLSIAKELAQRMDGSIGSNFQNGTLTVWVEFPAR